MKKIVFVILPIFLSLLLCFSVAELILRFTNYPKVLLVSKDDSDYIQPDSTLGYKYLLNLDIEIKSENYSVQVRTNSFGFRDDEWNFNKKYRNIFVLGNSFSVGYGLSVTERWSDRLDYLLNSELKEYSVYNISVSGYNLKQMIKAGSYLSSFTKPRIIIVGLYLGGLDRSRDPYIFYRGFAVRSSRIRYVKIKNDRLIFTHTKNEFFKSLESFIIVHSVFYNFIINNMNQLKVSFSEKYDPVRNLAYYKVNEMLGELKSNCDNENIKLIVLPVLQHDQDMSFCEKDVILYNELKVICEENNIYFADILPEIKKEIAAGNGFFIKNDRHWNKKAHLIAAKTLYVIIDKYKL